MRFPAPAAVDAAVTDTDSAAAAAAATSDATVSPFTAPAATLSSDRAASAAWMSEVAGPRADGAPGLGRFTLGRLIDWSTCPEADDGEAADGVAADGEAVERKAVERALAVAAGEAPGGRRSGPAREADTESDSGRSAEPPPLLWLGPDAVAGRWRRPEDPLVQAALAAVAPLRRWHPLLAPRSPANGTSGCSATLLEQWRYCHPFEVSEWGKKRGRALTLVPWGGFLKEGFPKKGDFSCFVLLSRWFPG
jgi:hypothetical protein